MKRLKNFLKKEKQALPREMEEIQQEYQQLSLQAGQNQYQAYVLSRDLERINQRLIDVNQEAAARQKLDKENKQNEVITPVESSAQ